MAKKRKKITLQKPPVSERLPHHEFEPSIPEWQECLIGRVIVAWSKIEAGLQDTIWKFLNLPFAQGRVLTCRLSVETLIATLRLLSQSRLTEDDHRQFSDTLDLVEIYKDARNLIAHGNWGTLKPDDVPIVASLRPRSPEDEVMSETFPRERMENLVAGMYEAIAALLIVQKWVDASRGAQQSPP